MIRFLPSRTMSNRSLPQNCPFSYVGCSTGNHRTKSSAIRATECGRTARIPCLRRPDTHPVPIRSLKCCLSFSRGRWKIPGRVPLPNYCRPCSTTMTVSPASLPSIRQLRWAANYPKSLPRTIRLPSAASVRNAFGLSIFKNSPRRIPMSQRLFSDGVTDDSNIKKVSQTPAQSRISRFQCFYMPSLYYLYFYCHKCHKCHCPIMTGLSSVTLSVTAAFFPSCCH